MSEDRCVREIRYTNPTQDLITCHRKPFICAISSQLCPCSTCVCCRLCGIKGCHINHPENGAYRFVTIKTCFPLNKGVLGRLQWHTKAAAGLEPRTCSSQNKSAFSIDSEVPSLWLLPLGRFTLAGRLMDRQQHHYTSCNPVEGYMLSVERGGGISDMNPSQRRQLSRPACRRTDVPPRSLDGLFNV